MSLQWYVIDTDKETKGPYSTEDIKRNLKDGDLSHKQPANRAGSDEWKPIAEWPEFARGRHVAPAAPRPSGLAQRTLPLTHAAALSAGTLVVGVLLGAAVFRASPAQPVVHIGVPPAPAEQGSSPSEMGAATSSVAPGRVVSLPVLAAERLVAGYLGEKDCLARAKYTVAGKANVERMRSRYVKKPRGCALKYDSIDASACAKLRPDKYCDGQVVASHRGETLFYWVKFTDGHAKIDWPASVGWNKTSLAALKAEMPRLDVDDPVTIRVLAKLSDYYNFEFSGRDRTMYSVELQAAHGRPPRLHAYVKKETDLGVRVLSLLKDGNERKVTVSVAYLPNAKNNDVAILGAIDDGWLHESGF